MEPLSDEPRKELIQSSWRRCVDQGLGPEHAPLLELAAHHHLTQQLEANARLVAFAQPIIEHLHQQLAQSSSMVLLADGAGLILRAVGDSGFVGRAARVALMPGATWSEEDMGTNAIGTALHETRMVAVCGDEHFLERNRFLTCIATPILAPTGGMLGILDLSSDNRVSLPHAQALLTTTAEMIEHRLLESMESGHVMVRFSPHAELLGSPLEALAVFDEGGAMLACNRRARALIGFAAGGALPGFADCFGEEWRSLGRLIRTAARAGAVTLRGQRQRNYFARFQLRRSEAQAAPVSPRSPASDCTAFDHLDHGDLRLREAIHRARRIAGRNIPLLIQGETGTGKELFAQAFHRDGPRRAGPFVAVNCAAIPSSLIEAELFGYAPGAYTGARAKGARGKLLEADGGTLFLDEIGDMPLHLQSVLLRVLETRCVTPLGSVEEIPIDIALVCASHRSLHEMVAAGEFRADLLFRLNGLTVSLPALRERTDFDALAMNLIEEDAAGRSVRLSPQALARLRQHRWPGNIRQLKNALRVGLALLEDDEDLLTEAHLPDELLEEVSNPGQEYAAPPSRDLRSTELRLIRDCLARHDGNVSATARELGITRTTLYRKLRHKPGANL
jgi:transcriptional regulator of acetoin/glycerol metabolism